MPPPTTPQPLQPGQQPTPQQLQAMQQQLAAEAAKNNMTIPQYVEHIKAQARQHAAQQQGRPQASQQQGQQVPINPQNAPDPKGIAVAKWLRSQNLKPRTCILNGQRKDMIKVKRAVRALQSDAYKKASSKNPLLPPVTDRSSAENVFKLLPLSFLALRVSNIDPHEGHTHAKPTKRIKGLWTVKIEQQQDVRDELHYVWLYEGPQWKQKLMAVGALIIIMALVMFPLWPSKLRLGVWYLSMGLLGLIGLFFVMAIFRLILFVVTMFAVPPGLWLFPNLFEDVGFFDSFKPLWGWQEEKKKGKKKKSKAVEGNGSADASSNASEKPKTPSATSMSAPRQHQAPQIEEIVDE